MCVCLCAGLFTRRRPSLPPLVRAQARLLPGRAWVPNAKTAASTFFAFATSAFACSLFLAFTLSVTLGDTADRSVNERTHVAFGKLPQDGPGYVTDDMRCRQSSESWLNTHQKVAGVLVSLRVEAYDVFRDKAFFQLESGGTGSYHNRS